LTVHPVETGRLTANRTFLRGEGFGSLLRPVEPFEFPALAYVAEHPEGLILVDTGIAADPPRPRRLRGFPPVPSRAAGDIASQLRERAIDPGEVRTVVLTHLDWDHTGGLRHFPRARVLVHRPEHEFAQTRMGRFRYQPEGWPSDLRLEVYDLEPEPYGPFPASRSVTDAGDVRVVPIPGHSPGQVAVACEAGDITLLFAADHMLRADWFTEDLAEGRLVMLGPFAKAEARETSRRLQRLTRERPTVLLPAHDEQAPTRLARCELTVA
jgi:glyoxylase-like metal-dependent hydrolase (beta-lactamase superfamily II)